MLSPEVFPIPTKVHFVSPEGLVVGTVFVDCVVPHPGGTSFYFGKICVAILTDSYLMIGPRLRERNALRREKPFWLDGGQTARKFPLEYSSRAVLGATA
jgi:hypothetical protein